MSRDETVYRMCAYLSAAVTGALAHAELWPFVVIGLVVVISFEQAARRS